MTGNSLDEVKMGQRTGKIGTEGIVLNSSKLAFEPDSSCTDNIEDEYRGEDFTLEIKVEDVTLNVQDDDIHNCDKGMNGDLEDATDEKMAFCVLCKKVVAVNWANVCAPCHKLWRHQYLEKFMSKTADSCLICVNSVCNQIPQCKHDCTSVNTFVCSLCDSVFVDKVHLTEHMKKRYGKKICCHCSMLFCYHSDMKSHKCGAHRTILRVNVENVINCVCNICQRKVFPENSECTHIHNSGEKLYKCSFCNETFRSDSLLKEHSSVHKSEEFKCTYCQKVFNYASHLKRHLLIHAKERSYKCVHCEMAFIRSDHLKQHLATHENKKTKDKHICTQCKKSFLKPSDLKRHIMIHENKRQYKCSYCKMSFIQSGNLKKHLMTHENKMSHKCVHCNKSFNQASNLKRHLVIHENKNKY